MRSPVVGRALSGALAVVMTASLCVVGAVTTSVPAFAVQPPQDRLVSDDPADFTPHVLDGEVKAVAVVGDTVVLGGNFTSVKNNGGTAYTQKNIVAFDRTTGVIDTDFAPTIDDTVRSLVPSADGQSVYVGGQFGQVNGAPTFKLARLDINTGQKVGGFDPGVINALIYDVKLVNNRLFIAGQFTQVGGQNRSMLAELDPANGAVRPDAWPEFAGVNGGGSTHLEKIDINPDGQTLVALGNFATLGGQPHMQVAMLTITPGAPAVTDWSTTDFDPQCIVNDNPFDLYVTDVEYSPDGSYFVISTTGGYGGLKKLCDSVTRWDADRRGSAVKPMWVDYSGGDSIYALAVTGEAIYTGGHHRWWNNPLGNNAEGPGAVSREGIAALDPLNGLPLSWNPTRDRGRGVFDMVATSDGLWVGSDTDRIGDFEFHGRIAFFPLAGGTDVPRPIAPTLPVDAYVLNGAGTPTVEHGMFDGETPGAVTDGAIAGLDPATTTGGFWLDGELYLSSTNRTLSVRSFDGDHIGTARTLDLHGMSQFPSELNKMSGLVYTPGSILYTLRGDAKLYRRYFTPESGVVGATRFTMGSGGVNWSKSRGMFLSGKYIFWSAKSTGALHRVVLGPTGIKAGSDLVVSSPTTDGRDWTGTAMFTLPPPAPNEPPVAAFDVSCVGPTCAFDATDSDDPDGDIVEYAWDFGDGTTAVGPEAQVEHTYPGAATYDVSLTVKDDEGAVGTTTGEATVVASEVAFVGSAHQVRDDTNLLQSVVLPATIEAGDQLVLTMGINNSTAVASDPPGWTRAATTSTTSMTSVVWLRTATVSDAGATVSVPLNTASRTSLLVGAYRDAIVPTGGISLIGETVNRATHTTPVIEAPDGSWVLQSWADKTAVTTAWLPPAGEVVRETGSATGTRVAWLLTDSGGPVAAGPVGGETATAQTPTGDSPTSNATMMTVVLAPAP